MDAFVRCPLDVFTFSTVSVVLLFIRVAVNEWKEKQILMKFASTGKRVAASMSSSSTHPVRIKFDQYSITVSDSDTSDFV